MKKYDIAAYIWPSYHDDPRSRIFWPQGMGEWQSVLSAKPKFEGHIEPRLPVWGPVNEADPYVMSMEIAAAADPKLANKPAEMLEKILAGKINRFFSEICLEDQPWVKDDKTSLKKFKPAVKVKRFVRWAIGEEL